MKPYLLTPCLSVLSTLMSIGLYTVPTITFAHTELHSNVQTVAYNSRSASVQYYGGTRFVYYPNHVIAADTYNKQVLKNMVGLTKSLGWDTVYIQNLPTGLRGYAVQYFSDHDLDLNLLSSEAELRAYSPPVVNNDDYDDDYDNSYSYRYVPDNTVQFLYGYGGGYNGYSGYNGWGNRWHGGGHHGGGGGHHGGGGGHHGGGGGGWGGGGGHHGGSGGGGGWGGGGGHHGGGGGGGGHRGGGGGRR